ncbi:hypothetical protein [Mariniluteicoccus flavus]
MSKEESLQALDRARLAREEAEAAELRAVAAAREAGVAWGRIGELYGLTKQGAQQRFKGRASAPGATEPGT